MMTVVTTISTAIVETTAPYWRNIGMGVYRKWWMPVSG
jgi:hypothetical protein